MMRPSFDSSAVASARLRPVTFGRATGGGPLEITMLTAVSRGSTVPAGGSVPTTEPFFTVGLSPIVIVPS